MTQQDSGFGHNQVPGDLESRDEGAQLNLFTGPRGQPVSAAGGKGWLFTPASMAPQSGSPGQDGASQAQCRWDYVVGRDVQGLPDPAGVIWGKERG